MLNADNVKDYLNALDLHAQDGDLDLVRNIQSRHMAKFSFNSVSVVLGLEISLQLDQVFNKIVHRGFGGYCFEHNLLVFAVLKTLGFDVTLSMARVVNNKPFDVPRTHRLTLLKHDADTYIVDAGFGHLAARFPLLFAPGVEQRQGDDVYRIADVGSDTFAVQVLKGDDFYSLYTFDFNHYTDMDCVSGNFYSYRHPDAVFVNNLVAVLKTETVTYSLRNGHLHQIEPHQTIARSIDSADDLHHLLSETFALELELPVCQYLFARFVKQDLDAELPLQPLMEQWSDIDQPDSV